MKPDKGKPPVHLMLENEPVATPEKEAATDRQPVRAADPTADFLQLALKSGRMITWEWDISAGTIRYSENFPEYIGSRDIRAYTSLERLMELIHPEDTPRLKQALQQTIRDGTPFECEYRVRMPDGCWRWFLGMGCTALREGSNPVKVSGVTLDIARHKQEEEARKESENLQQAIQMEEALQVQRDLGLRLLAINSLEEAVPLCLDAGLVISGFEAGGIYLLDDTGDLRLAFHGGISTEFAGKNAFFPASSEVASWVKNGRPYHGKAEDLPAPLLESVRREGLQTVSIIPIVREDRILALINLASRQWIELPRTVCHLLESIASQMGVFLERLQSQNALQQAFVTLEKRIAQRTAELRLEVAERRRAEEKLRLSEQRHRDLVETVPDWVWEVNEEAVYTFCGPQSRAMLGYEPEEILGRSPFDLMPPEEAARVAALAGPLMERRAPILALENTLRRKDGSMVTLETNGVPVFDAEGNWRGYRGLDHDLTERKRIEAQLRQARDQADAANRAKSLFLASMSHEIRTPMNAILGFTQLMQRDPALTPRQREHLATIDRSGEFLLRLINDILDLSKIEAGKMQLDPSDFHFHSLLGDLSSMVKCQGEDKGLSFLSSVAADVPAHLHTDAGKVRQVLLNLLGNAVRFTASGGIRLKVSAERSFSGEGNIQSVWIHAEVEDTGPGIDPQNLEQVFESFEQTGNRRGQTGGTGLGLAISRQLARLLGGDIAVTSQPGQGSTFRFSFPATLPDPAPGSPYLPADSHAPLRLKPGGPVPAILVVDDIESNRRLLKQLLESVGFLVREAASGEEALAACHAEPPRLILLDRRMPGMDGLETARAIRCRSLLQSIRIFLISASVLDVREEEWKSAGVDDFISKPVRLTDLLQRIGILLGVEYVMEESVPRISPMPPPQAEDFMALPEELRGKMVRAAESGHMRLLQKLITQEVAPGYPRQGEALSRWAEQYDYEAILRALQ